MDLTGQKLMINSFHDFIEVSPPMSIHSMGHHKGTMMGEEM